MRTPQKKGSTRQVRGSLKNNFRATSKTPFKRDRVEHLRDFNRVNKVEILRIGMLTKLFEAHDFPSTETVGG